MLGLTDLQLFEFSSVTVISAIAAWTDARVHRIFNALTLPTLLGGVLLHALSGGFVGVSGALAGIGVAVVLTGWMYALRFLGAGDVKLLMALGAWVGPWVILEVALLSLFLGGAMAVVQLALKGRLLSFARRASLFAASWLFRELKHARPEFDPSLKLPFGVAIGAAAVGTVWMHPLQGWLPAHLASSGVLPW